VFLRGKSTVTYGSLSDRYEEIQFKTAITLTAGQSYWFVLQQSAAPTGGTVELDSIATGTAVHAVSANGTTWTLQNGKELWLKRGQERQAVTAVAVDNASVARYGLYEKRLDTRLAEREAEAQRDGYLAAYAWPTSAVTSLRVGDAGTIAELDVELVGFSYQLRGRLLDFNGEIAAGRNTFGELVRFIGQECGLVPADVRDNLLTWSQETAEDALSMFIKICQLGGSDLVPWHFRIAAGHRFNYTPRPTGVRYYLFGGQLRDRNNRPVTGDEVRRVLPGVVRRMGIPRPTRPGHWLPDGRDFFASRIEVDAEGQLTMSVDGYDEFELMNAQADIQRIEEQNG
jgi:hypothetical protein